MAIDPHCMLGEGMDFGGTLGGKTAQIEHRREKTLIAETRIITGFYIFSGVLRLHEFTFVISRSPVQVRALAPLESII